MTPKPPTAVIPTPYGVYEIPAEEIVSLSLNVENPRERFVPVRKSGREYWEMRILLPRLVGDGKPPSLWKHLKNWWRIRKYSRRRLDIEPRRS